MSSLEEKNLIEVCVRVSQEYNLVVAINESTNAFVVTGLGALLGGLMGGREGLLAGGSIAAVCSSFASSGKFKSVVEIISSMNNAEKKKLADYVKSQIGRINLSNLKWLLSYVLDNGELIGIIIDAITYYMKNEKGLVVESKQQ